MDDLNIPDAAVGPVIAAAIAGLVVFISTVLTKEQKTSEFRQVWIDEIRTDISEYMSGVSEVVAMSKKKKVGTEEHDKFLDDNFELFHELQAIEHRIVLRLNTTEHAELITKVREFRKQMLHAHKQVNPKKIEQQLTDELVQSTKEVLTYEWKRVKKGEPSFRVGKWGALTLMSFFAAVVFGKALFSNSGVTKPASAPAQNQVILQVLPDPTTPVLTPTKAVTLRK
ncbi:MAG TPA: hypothetical protein VIT92_14225 [Burkholderiaceae bacterium]